VQRTAHSHIKEAAVADLTCLLKTGQKDAHYGDEADL
jgi:hypothetical protein